MYDANNLPGDASITLTEPEPLKIFAEAYKYPSGHNISCFNCYNGSIDVAVENGIAPYTYDWDDGTTTQDRMGLGEGTYLVKVTDQNGCFVKPDVSLTQPESNDWTMSGNANTNPAVHYFGTSDNKDVVFKSNGQEALRLKSNGDISLIGSLVGSGIVMRGADGKLTIADPVLTAATPCAVEAYPFWLTNGNISSCAPELVNLV